MIILLLWYGDRLGRWLRGIVSSQGPSTTNFSSWLGGQIRRTTVKLVSSRFGTGGVSVLELVEDMILLSGASSQRRTHQAKICLQDVCPENIAMFAPRVPEGSGQV